jgi:hypothetical protein
VIIGWSLLPKGRMETRMQRSRCHASLFMWSDCIGPARAEVGLRGDRGEVAIGLSRPCISPAPWPDRSGSRLGLVVPRFCTFVNPIRAACVQLRWSHMYDTPVGRTYQHEGNATSERHRAFGRTARQATCRVSALQPRGQEFDSSVRHKKKSGGGFMP